MNHRLFVIITRSSYSTGGQNKLASINHFDRTNSYLNIKLEESDNIIRKRKGKDDDNEEQAVAPGGWLEKLSCQENQKR